MDAVTNVPLPVNEPVRSHAPGSPERAALENRVKELAGERAELTMIPAIVRQTADDAMLRDALGPHLAR